MTDCCKYHRTPFEERESPHIVKREDRFTEIIVEYKAMATIKILQTDIFSQPA